MKVIVEKEFWELFPQAQISIMVAKGLDNSVDESKDTYFKSLLIREVSEQKLLLKMTHLLKIL